jgi:GT2 family glycosyltransferase
VISYSIIICTYNQKITLQGILESLRRQIKNPKLYEIVITDDGSNDGTDDFVKKLRFPIFLKYIRSESSIGRSANRNRGFQRAAGQSIIFIDGDMIPSPDFIESYHAAWRDYPDSVCVGSWKLPDEWNPTPYLRYLGSRGRLQFSSGARVPGKYFASGNFSISKLLLDSLGGFDTEFKSWGGEDTDFGFRLESKNIPIVYIPSAACSHYHRKSLDEILAEYVKFGEDGFPILVRKYPEKVIFEKGWLLGLPGSGMSSSKRLISIALWPLRSATAMALLRYLARIDQGKLFNDILFDWLFYGHLARGFRNRKR